MSYFSKTRFDIIVLSKNWPSKVVCAVFKKCKILGFHGSNSEDCSFQILTSQRLVDGKKVYEELAIFVLSLHRRQNLIQDVIFCLSVQV
jgi:hypothetical protein